MPLYLFYYLTVYNTCLPLFCDKITWSLTVYLQQCTSVNMHWQQFIFIVTDLQLILFRTLWVLSLDQDFNRISFKKDDDAFAARRSWSGNLMTTAVDFLFILLPTILFLSVSVFGFCRIYYCKGLSSNLFFLGLIPGQVDFSTSMLSRVSS